FNHPNIVRVLAFFEEHNTAYIVMQYEVGENLSSYLKKQAYLSEQRLLEIFCPINDGLINVHKHGYIHRDIKPDNIYIREDNSPVLLDFGASRDVFNARVDQFTRILTKGYAPYEQDNPAWANQGAWTDIYALGATLFYTMTRQRVVSAQERASAFMRNEADPYQSLAGILSHKYSAHFLQAVDHALAFHPDQRPQSIAAWNQALLGDQRNDDEKTQIIFPKKASAEVDEIADVTQLYSSSYQPQSVKEKNQTVSSNNQQEKQVEKDKRTSKNKINNQKANKSEKNWLVVGLFIFIISLSSALVYGLMNSDHFSMQQIMVSLGLNQPAEVASETKQSFATTNSEAVVEETINNDQVILVEKLANETAPIEQNDHQEDATSELAETVTVEDENTESKVNINSDGVSANNIESRNEHEIIQVDKLEKAGSQDQKEQQEIGEIAAVTLDENSSYTLGKVETDAANTQVILDQIESEKNIQKTKTNQELLQRTVDAALNHAKTAARSYLRAEMDSQLIKEFESLDSMSNRTKYIANLKVQRDKFLVGFQKQFDLYDKELEKLRAHKIADVQAALTSVTDEKYQGSQTYIALGDVLMNHISAPDINHNEWQKDLKAVGQQSGVFRP
ncbi:MAG: serine/threonine protein kinase, partial [bacterium]